MDEIVPERMLSRIVRHLLKAFLAAVDEEGKPMIAAAIMGEVKLVIDYDEEE